MAKDLAIGKKEIQDLNPGCNDAPHCCWYETTKEYSNTCANRNALICKLHRDEVFSQKELDSFETLKQVGGAAKVI
ncbi:MAG: hypothetical protein LBF22_05885 [Deltaproteobacteria bacterium]|jgi:hypothetical protein|nr:hypothetical protein [Deltaproteobacteria bacterium]